MTPRVQSNMLINVMTVGFSEPTILKIIGAVMRLTVIVKHCVVETGMKLTATNLERVR